MSKGKIVIGIFAFVVMIFGIIGLANSFNNLNEDITEIENKQVVCEDWKAELDLRKATIDNMPYSYQSMKYVEQYNIDMAEYIKGCS